MQIDTVRPLLDAVGDLEFEAVELDRLQDPDVGDDAVQDGGEQPDDGVDDGRVVHASGGYVSSQGQVTLKAEHHQHEAAARRERGCNNRRPSNTQG